MKSRNVFPLSERHAQQCLTLILAGGSESQPVNKLEHIGRGSTCCARFYVLLLLQAPLQTAANAAFLAQVYAQMRPGEDVDRHTCWAGEHSRHAHFDHISGRL